MVNPFLTSHCYSCSLPQYIFLFLSLALYMSLPQMNDSFKQAVCMHGDSLNYTDVVCISVITSCACMHLCGPVLAHHSCNECVQTRICITHSWFATFILSLFVKLHCIQWHQKCYAIPTDFFCGDVFAYFLL